MGVSSFSPLPQEVLFRVSTRYSNKASNQGKVVVEQASTATFLVYTDYR